ncbi:MAG: SPOR domain-containing protein [Gemmatimonadaceae bacterium]
MSRWLAEGRTLGLTLGHSHAVLVAGGDADATADVALGIAETQSAGRHVVLGDLSANTARFASLVADDDPHGLVDAFDYGISLGRVARPVDGHHNLHFAPTGAIAPDYPELLAHPRWSKLLTAFTDADHLLVIVIPVDTVGLDDFVRHFDGLVLVDSRTPAGIDESRVIANVVLGPIAPPRIEPVVEQPTPTPTPAPTPAPTPVVRKKAITKPVPVTKPAPDAPIPVPPQPVKPVAIPAAPVARPTGVFTAFAKPAGYGAGLSILAAFIIFWFMNQPFGDDDSRPLIPGPLPQVPRAQPPAASKPADPNQANPADSGGAVYAVRMLSANTLNGAILKLQEFGASMPAATFAEVDKSGRTWYEVLTGAFTTRGGADSLLTSLRSAGHLDSISPGVVVRAPYAVLIDSVRMSASVSDLLVSLRMRQLPVYALQQRNDWVWVVAGAFETRAHADAYREKIRASGQPADVVIRKGRMF